MSNDKKEWSTMAAGSGSYDADADATDAADDQHEFIRSLFTISTDCHGDDDDCDGDDDDISEHTWICPNNSSLSIIYHLTIYAQAMAIGYGTPRLASHNIY